VMITLAHSCKDGDIIENEENRDARDSADKQQDIPNHPWPCLREIVGIHLKKHRGKCIFLLLSKSYM